MTEFGCFLGRNWRRKRWFTRVKPILEKYSSGAIEASLNLSVSYGMVSPMNSASPSEVRPAGIMETLEPCSIIIFGASGDLTARKLIPALYHLTKDKQMPASFRIIGFARREKTDESWRQELRAALNQFSRSKPVDDKLWESFSKNIFYCVGDMTDPAAYEKLEQKLSSFGQPQLRENLLFYLATQPSQFGTVAEQLHKAKL